MKFDFNKIDDDISLSDRGLGSLITPSTNTSIKSKRLKESLNKKSKLTEGFTYYNLPDVKVIPHGEWADAEIEYNGKLYNEYEVSTKLYLMFTEEVPYIMGNEDEDAKFNQWCADNPDKIYELLNDLEPVEILDDSDIDPYDLTDCEMDANGDIVCESKTQKLTEGTSNFKSMKDLPLLVFVTEDEIEWDENGDPVDSDLAEFLLYDEHIDKLTDFLDEQNLKIAQKADDVADKAWDLRIDLESTDIEHFNKDQWEQLDNLEAEADYLKDCQFELKIGYYQGYQIYMDADCFALLNDADKAFIKQLFTEIKKEFGLKELAVAYRMSNGETGYNKVTESYSKQDAITAIMDAYGCSKTEAQGALETLAPDTIKELVKGYKERAKASFYND